MLMAKFNKNSSVSKKVCEFNKAALRLLFDIMLILMCTGERVFQCFSRERS